MTTTVKIDAHVSKDKQVRVLIINNGTAPVADFTLQDGESAERVVYDDLQVSVKEELKP